MKDLLRYERGKMHSQIQDMVNSVIETLESWEPVFTTQEREGHLIRGNVDKKYHLYQARQPEVMGWVNTHHKTGLKFAVVIQIGLHFTG